MSEVQDAQGAQHYAWQAHLPSLVSSLAPSRRSLLPCLLCAPRPLLAPSALRGPCLLSPARLRTRFLRPSSVPWPLLSERARCIAFGGALAPSVVPRVAHAPPPMFWPCPSSSPLCLCAHDVEQCARHPRSHSSLPPLLHLLLGPLCRSGPLLPLRLSYPRPLCAFSRMALSTVCKAPCTTRTFPTVSPSSPLGRLTKCTSCCSS